MGKALKATEDQLKEILGNSSDAQALYSILHSDPRPTEEDEGSKLKGKAKMRRRPFKK